LELKGGMPGKCHKKKEVDINIDEYHKMIDKYIEDNNVFLSSYYSLECKAVEYAEENNENIFGEKTREIMSIFNDFNPEIEIEKQSQFLDNDNIFNILNNIYILNEKKSNILKDSNNKKIIQDFETLSSDSNKINNIIELLLKIKYISSRIETHDVIHEKLKEINEKLEEYLNICKIIFEKFFHSKDCVEYLICEQILDKYKKGKKIEYYSEYSDIVHYYTSFSDMNNYKIISKIISGKKKDYDKIINQIHVLTENQNTNANLTSEILKLLTILNTKKTSLEFSITSYLKKFEAVQFKIDISQLEIKSKSLDYNLYNIIFPSNISELFDKIWTFIKTETKITDDSYDSSNYTISINEEKLEKTQSILDLFGNPNINSQTIKIVKIL